MLRIEELGKRFGGLNALKDVTVRAAPAEITAVIGPNGAGKSTLMNIISGVISPDHGRVEVAGVPITGLKPHEVCRQQPGSSHAVTRLSTALQFGQPFTSSAGSNGFGARRICASVPRQSQSSHVTLSASSVAVISVLSCL